METCLQTRKPLYYAHRIHLHMKWQQQQQKRELVRNHWTNINHIVIVLFKTHKRFLADFNNNNKKTRSKRMEAHTHTHTIASELENPAKMHCMEPKSLKDTTKESNDCSHTKWLNIWNQYSICKMGKKRNIKPIWFGRLQYAA